MSVKVCPYNTLSLETLAPPYQQFCNYSPVFTLKSYCIHLLFAITSMFAPISTISSFFYVRLVMEAEVQV